MHNRTRMLAASFLVKDLLVPWQTGATWFWDTLVDADLANNTLGWQWVAGCGADAAPYFRVLNPVTQGRRFDPDGAYVRRWVPELAGLHAEQVQAPWLAPAGALVDAGVVLGGPTRRRSSTTARPACARSEPTRWCEGAEGHQAARRPEARLPRLARPQSSETIRGAGRPSAPTVTSAHVRASPNRALPAAPGLRNRVSPRHSTAALWLWPLTPRSSPRPRGRAGP